MFPNTCFIMYFILQYIEKLEELLFVSSNSSRKPDNDKLKEYQKKIGFLKDFVATKNLVYICIFYTEFVVLINEFILIILQPSAVDKAKANRLLAPANTQTIPSVVTSPTGLF